MCTILWLEWQQQKQPALCISDFPSKIVLLASVVISRAEWRRKTNNGSFQPVSNRKKNFSRRLMHFEIFDIRSHHFHWSWTHAFGVCCACPQRSLFIVLKCHHVSVSVTIWHKYIQNKLQWQTGPELPLGLDVLPNVWFLDGIWQETVWNS